MPETEMSKKKKISAILLACAALSLGMHSAIADKGNDDHNNQPGNLGEHGNGNGHKLSVTVSFGAGLNTAQPGNSANHHILPPLIRIAEGGVVNFAVAGFHQVMVYQPGVKAADIALPTDASALFINFAPNLFYRGIAPAGGPPPGNPPTIEPSNGSNRIESVSFPQKGTYLVICNVRPHFADGMYAYVQVD
jgi:plastocyanin